MNRLTIVLLFFVTNLNAQDNEDLDSCLVVPTTISQKNKEKLLIESNCELSAFHFLLFNRWGELLYETFDLDFPLDFDVAEMTGTKRKPLLKYDYGSTYFWKIYYKVYREEESEIVQSTAGTLKIL